MRSKNAARITPAESAHMARVKELPCSVCDAPPPSAAHHINQGQHYTTVALCWQCHQGKDGWHGTKVLWRIRKMDELDALNITLARLESCQ
jgi:hypothetical protein